ncbi:Holliday junction resolvase RuvX [Sphaerobacter thermophilus]|uniref:Putative pre-16S rRNA nuclease n=1 Tax=Sphaerobacter thermophilus (strain ATCC 49802 / DSM 20745 / KCCM 41009 / NCIMB 13125 / S 6022) TaxID=479434 RepID=D1C428_SPHTD|nr:Holliday junction resolvase RuvX [Sphaerobacter thermophilus]ACZ38995.1 Holliday junction resolvase YqgF [Sphaerobacter thermophilus DSM 20745]
MASSSQPGRRLIALDVGARRVGVAVSDELGLIASPVESVDMKRDGMDRLVALIERYDPERIIIGLPLGMSGREGPQAAATRAFAQQLRGRVDRPIIFWDERLTTFMADQSLIEAGHRRARRKQHVDAVAAALILQSYLDSQRA